jgi:hypothetical protein
VKSVGRSEEAGRVPVAGNAASLLRLRRQSFGASVGACAVNTCGASVGRSDRGSRLFRNFAGFRVFQQKWRQLASDIWFKSSVWAYRTRSVFILVREKVLRLRVHGRLLMASDDIRSQSRGCHLHVDKPVSVTSLASMLPPFAPRFFSPRQTYTDVPWYASS